MSKLYYVAHYLPSPSMPVIEDSSNILFVKNKAGMYCSIRVFKFSPGPFRRGGGGKNGNVNIIFQSALFPVHLQIHETINQITMA